MAFFTNSSINTKLKIVIMSTTFLAVAFVLTGFFIYERITFEEIFINDLRTKADIIAENINAALIFQDSTDAARVLGSLRSQPRIMSAAVYDRQGTLFASYSREGFSAQFPPQPESGQIRYDDDALILSSNIIVNDERIGSLYVRTDLLLQSERFRSYLQIALLVLFGALALAYFMAAVLARNISRPIKHLVSTVQTISLRQDYSLRAVRTTNDETGFLADAFNGMLHRIQERDSNLQKSEERYRTTLDYMQEGCQIIGFDFRYLYVNDVVAQQGRIPKEELLGRTMMEKYPGIEKTAMFATVEQCMETRKAFRLENEFLFPDGSAGWFDLNIEPVPEGVFIISTDITQKKKTEAELLEYREHLEELVQERTAQLGAVNKELESFSYSVSHDLRAPLRHIDGFVDLLTKQSAETLDEKSKRYLSIISQSSRQMGELIDDLLIFSRMGKTALSPASVDLNGLVNEVIASLDAETKGRAIVWTIQQLPAVTADLSMMKLVFQNLIGNALKYSRPKTEAEISVGHYRDGRKGEVFFVSDNGVGFDMQYVNKLFGVFQRLHRAEDFEGTGIGLANVQRIVQRHGGTVWAESIPDEKTTFYFTLPVTI